jgi:hypothetical protein
VLSTMSTRVLQHLHGHMGGVPCRS